MKKLILMFGLVAAGLPLVQAETLQFVTRLSAPLGAVAQLDTANPAAVTEVPRVNFCTQQATSGDVSFTGGADPQFGTVSLGASRRITSDNLQELRVDYIYLRNGGSLTAGRLFADKITLPANKTTRGSVGESLYLNNISSFVDVQGVKADALYIKDSAGNNLAFINEAGSGTALHWSNIYDHPYKSDGSPYENVDYSTQWVLKQEGGTLACRAPTATYQQNCTDSNGLINWKSNAETCPCECQEEGAVLQTDGTCSVPDEWVMQYKALTFAFAGHPTNRYYKCLGASSFQTVKGNGTPGTGSEPFPSYTKAEKWFTLDSTAGGISSNLGGGYSVSNSGLGTKTLRQMIYQCAFRQNMRIQKLTCSPGNSNAWECWQNTCKNAPENTIFIAETDVLSSSRFNGGQAKAEQPRKILGYANDNEYYCYNGLPGPTSSAGGRMYDWPCFGFHQLMFYTCWKNDEAPAWWNTAFADDSQSEWAPNESFTVLP